MTASWCGSSFTGCVQLAPQNTYPIIVYFLSILWLNMDPILVTLGYYSICFGSILWPIINPILVTFRQMIFYSQSSENVRPHSSNSIENF